MGVDVTVSDRSPRLPGDPHDQEDGAERNRGGGDEAQAQEATESGRRNGSDGTRTRDLRRDRSSISPANEGFSARFVLLNRSVSITPGSAAWWPKLWPHHRGREGPRCTAASGWTEQATSSFSQRSCSDEYQRRRSWWMDPGAAASETRPHRQAKAASNAGQQRPDVLRSEVAGPRRRQRRKRLGPAWVEPTPSGKWRPKRGRLRRTTSTSGWPIR